MDAQFPQAASQYGNHLYPQVLSLDDISGLGDPAQAVVDVAAHRVHLGAVDAGPEDLLHVLGGYPGIHQHGPIGLAHHLGIPGPGELVFYLADNLLQQVLHGDDVMTGEFKCQPTLHTLHVEQG